MSQSTRIFENRIESEKVEAASDRDDTDHFSSDVNEAMGRIKYLKKRKRLRWRSFYTAHQPSFRSQSIQLNALSVGQVIILRKLAVLKMTALIERFR